MRDSLDLAPSSESISTLLKYISAKSRRLGARCGVDTDEVERVRC